MSRFSPSRSALGRRQLLFGNGALTLSSFVLPRDFSEDLTGDDAEALERGMLFIDTLALTQERNDHNVDLQLNNDASNVVLADPLPPPRPSRPGTGKPFNERRRARTATI